jgi:hypothetical protein
MRICGQNYKVMAERLLSEEYAEVLRKVMQ